ncbi:MAG: outer membrane protein assembly factor [Burkholderiales bacterium]|nr:MAG: outer membrane protein assembly factor [Burkholderiales bacterium]
MALLALAAAAQASAGGVGDLPPETQARAETPHGNGTAGAPSRPDATAAPGPRFEIDLKAPEAIRPFLLRHMNLQRFRLLEDLDSAELDRLLARAPDDLGGLLGTLGYFSPRIEVARMDSAPPDLGVVRIDVEPGPPTRVVTARVFFRGEIVDSPAAAGQREAIEQDVSRPVGEVFTQADWEQVKTQVLRRLTVERYPNGRLLNSLADIDAQAREAHLYIELDSGPARRLGRIEVLGAQRYDAERARRLARLAGIEPGIDYSLEVLQAAQSRLAGSDLYETALVTVEPTGEETDLPVLIQLRERRHQRLQLGLGASTDNGPRLSVEHLHRDVPGIGWRVDNRLQVERQDRLAQTAWTSPVDDKAWRWVTSARWSEQIDGFNTTTSQRLLWGRSREETTRDQSQFVQFERARTVNSALRMAVSEKSRSSLSLNQAWTWRRFDDLVFPERGQGLAVELGLGATLETPAQPFARLNARWLTYWPVGGAVPAPPQRPGQAREPERSQPRGSLGRLALRLEGGAVLARRETVLPDTLLFLTGGDATVRGYGLREIGIPSTTGTLEPGRYLAVASLEWQRPIRRNGEPGPWEHVLFVDGGAVADRPEDLRVRWGVGSGIRYNSPVGPLQVDLAYGLEPREWRLHLRVGFAF